MRDLLIGVDIGGTKINAALVQPGGGALSWERCSTRAAYEHGSLLEGVVAVIRRLVARVPNGQRVGAIGVATGGVVDTSTGVVVAANGLLPGWKGVNVGEEIGRRFGAVAVVENDVNAFAVGEQRYGRAQGASIALFVTVGTGIGGALTVKGELVRGAHGAAGELGHVSVPGAGERVCNCGAHGHLEAVASGPAMAERYASLAEDQTVVGFEDVVARGLAGEEAAVSVIAEGAAALGLCLSSLVTVFDPACLVLGGGVVLGAGDLLWAPLLRRIRRMLPPGRPMPEVLRSQLADRAAVLGVVALAQARAADGPDRRPAGSRP